MTAARGHQQIWLDNQAVLHTSDMEIVTNGTCVKYGWARLKFSRINAKNYLFCEISQIQVRFKRFSGKIESSEISLVYTFDKFHVCHTYVCILNARQT